MRELDRLKLYRARSRLYRSQILQVNTRWKALAEIYTMHSFAPFSKFSLETRKLEAALDSRSLETTSFDLTFRTIFAPMRRVSAFEANATLILC